MAGIVGYEVTRHRHQIGLEGIAGGNRLLYVPRFREGLEMQVADLHDAETVHLRRQMRKRDRDSRHLQTPTPQLSS